MTIGQRLVNDSLQHDHQTLEMTWLDRKNFFSVASSYKMCPTHLFLNSLDVIFLWEYWMPFLYFSLFLTKAFFMPLFGPRIKGGNFYKSSPLETRFLKKENFLHSTRVPLIVVKLMLQHSAQSVGWFVKG